MLRARGLHAREQSPEWLLDTVTQNMASQLTEDRPAFKEGGLCKHHRQDDRKESRRKNDRDK